jgi:hypothetical protein
VLFEENGICQENGLEGIALDMEEDRQYQTNVRKGSVLT